MSIGRIATGMQGTQSTQWFQQSQVRLNQLQEKAATGKNILRPSDDPLGLIQLMDVTRSMNEDDQYLRNIATGVSELSTTDTAMTQMLSVLQRASELATQGSNVTTGAAGMKSIAKEVNALVDQLVQLGNSQQSGVYLFSGAKTGTQAYSRTGDVVTYAGTSQSQPFQRTIEIAKQSTITINVTGDTLLGDTTSGAFKVLIDLKNALDAGDTTTTRAQLDLLKTNIDNLVNQQANIGSTLNQLNLTQERTQSKQDVASQFYSQLQDVDMPQLITNLRFQEQINEASLGVMGRILPKSIFNFLS